MNILCISVGGISCLNTVPREQATPVYHIKCVMGSLEKGVLLF